MSKLKRDLPKEIFDFEDDRKKHMENEVMHQLDFIETKSVKPLGVKPQLMGIFVLLFFVIMGVFGVYANVEPDFEFLSFRGFSIASFFNKIPVEMHYAVLILSSILLLYLMFRLIKDVSTSVVKQDS